MNENKRQKIDNIIGKLKTLDYQLRNSRFLPDDKPKNVLEGAIAQLDSIEGSIKEVISCELDSHSSVPGNLRPADIPEAMRLAIYHLNNAKMKIKPVKDAIVKATGEFNPPALAGIRLRNDGHLHGRSYLNHSRPGGCEKRILICQQTRTHFSDTRQ